MQKSIVNDLSAFGRHAPRGLTQAILEITRGCPATWGGARRAFFLRALGVKMLSGRPLDVESLGVRMRLYPANNRCEKRLLFTPHYFDPAERALLASVACEDMHLVDIGASAGGYALSMAGLAGARAGQCCATHQPGPRR